MLRKHGADSPGRPGIQPSAATLGLMERYEIAEAAGSAGVYVDELGRLIEFGIVGPGADDRFSPGDVRRVSLRVNHWAPRRSFSRGW
jgi:hypothetical protein